MRMIDADEFIKKICNICNAYYEDEPNEPCRPKECFAMRAIKDMLTLTPQNEWVSVEDRLPPDMGDVLVVAFWHESWQTMIGWHSDTDKKWRVITPRGEMEPGIVTHWVELPAPPDRRPPEGEDGDADRG